jgi:hypothetical protein
VTGGDKCLNPMAWTKEGSLIRPGSLPTHLYAAHVIYQSSSLSRLVRVEKEFCQLVFHKELELAFSF